MIKIKKYFFHLLIIAFLLFFLSSCKQAEAPSVEFVKYEIQETNLEKTTLNFIFHAKNPNPIAIDNAYYDLLLNVNNKNILNRKNAKIYIAPSTTTQIIMPADIDHMKLFRDYPEFLNAMSANNPNVRYRLNGDFLFNILTSAIKTPFNVEGTLELPSMPEINVSQLKIQEFSMSRITLRLEMDIMNRNNFPINIDSFSYNLNVNNTRIASGSSSRSLALKVKQKNPVAITFSFNPLTVGDGVFEALQRNDTAFELNGTINSGKVEIPFVKNGYFSK